MLELIVQVDCERFGDNDILSLAIKDTEQPLSIEPRRVLSLQYSSLIGEYADYALYQDTPKFDHESIMADSKSASRILGSKELTAIFFTNGRTKRLKLKYAEKKAPVIHKLQRLFDAFSKLAEGQYTQAELPQNAVEQDTFTSHHPSQFSIFTIPGTAQENQTYVRFIKGQNTIVYKLTQIILTKIRKKKLCRKNMAVWIMKMNGLEYLENQDFYEDFKSFDWEEYDSLKDDAPRRLRYEIEIGIRWAKKLKGLIIGYTSPYTPNPELEFLNDPLQYLLFQAETEYVKRPLGIWRPKEFIEE